MPSPPLFVAFTPVSSPRCEFPKKSPSSELWSRVMFEILLRAVAMTPMPSSKPVISPFSIVTRSNPPSVKLSTPVVPVWPLVFSIVKPCRFTVIPAAPTMIAACSAARLHTMLCVRVTLWKMTWLHFGFFEDTLRVAAARPGTATAAPPNASATSPKRQSVLLKALFMQLLLVGLTPAQVMVGSTSVLLEGTVPADSPVTRWTLGLNGGLRPRWVPQSYLARPVAGS
jgi:hypothetical protein